MKKIAQLLLSVVLIASLTACGGEKVDTTNTLTTAQLTPREEMLAGSQNIVITDFETDPSLQTVQVTVECYQNGKRTDAVTNLQCAIPQNADKEHENNRGSIAVILSADYRFSASVCGADGSVISSAASDAVQPIAELGRYDTPLLHFENQKFESGDSVLLSQLAFGDPAKMQGTFTSEVFSDPEANAEQAAAFDRIYLVKCVFA